MSATLTQTSTISRQSKDANSPYVYSFGNGTADGSADLRNLLGGKGANLAEMTALGLPVPPGFTLTTEVCTAYYTNNQQYPAGLEAEISTAITKIETQLKMKFGDADNPLLFSVRSGARISMPGMMDTILNLGLNDQTTAGLARRSGNDRFAYDSYRRFIQIYGNVVLGIEHHEFEDLLDECKQTHGHKQDTDLSAADWQRLIEQYEQIIRTHTGSSFPQDPKTQLWGAINAVFGSWMNQRAQTYRRLHNIPEEWGTAVTIQAMVFGNIGADCATGVAFTRNPSTGENHFFGEFLVNAQGEDVVAGIRTPHPLTEQARQSDADHPALETTLPETYHALCAVRSQLEAHYRDMQDIEFTVQSGQLFMLQTRSGKRSIRAALRIAADMVAEGLLTKQEAIHRIDPAALDQLLHPTLDPKAPRAVITRGLPASPGAATGTIVFTAEDAETMSQKGQAVILVRTETSPEDIHGMHAAKGILTCRGGMTSHAAVVARGMGRPCVAGAGALFIDLAAQHMQIGALTLKSGDLLTIDGSTGDVIQGAVPMVQPDLSDDFTKIMEWADQNRRLGVRANADTPYDAQIARNFGAEGIGLCRTEHMFFEEGRIIAMREMILAENTKARQGALDKLLPMQRDDFVAIFRVMQGLPVTIRLLDPPLNEFLPHSEAALDQLADSTGLDSQALRVRHAALTEMNPMLGHRGCRLAISYPEIAEMQARAIFEAVILAKNETGEAVIPEIMIPLVASGAETKQVKTIIDRIADAVRQESRQEFHYQVGTMIELPRACLCAGEIAEMASFFSFGTNDLTQTTFGISRDDAAHFLPDYERLRLFTCDPFVSIDREGVGALIKIAAERGRQTRPEIKLGICGEHGGDPDSIAFCDQIELDYVSCSPFRVPIARLAAAQAALDYKKKKSV